MFNINNLANIGAKFCINNGPADDLPTSFVMNLFEFRKNVAIDIAQKYSKFQIVTELIEKTDKQMNMDGNTEGLMQEYDAVCDFISDDNIKLNIDFLSLSAGYMGFMSRFNPPEDNDARYPLKVIENIDAELMGLPAIALVCVGLWFSDYNGYQRLVMDELKERGYFDQVISGLSRDWERENEDNKVSRHYPDDIIILKPEKELTKEDVEHTEPSNFAYYGYSAWENMMKEDDASWCTQMTSSLNDMIPYGRMQFLHMYVKVNNELNGSLDKLYRKVQEIAKKKASSVTRDFDMTITYQELVKEEVYIDVPKEVRKGLFKKETIIEKQVQTKISHAPQTLSFNAWRIEHFEREYRVNTSPYGYSVYDNWDYCLGDDGGLYLISSAYTVWDDNERQDGSGLSYSIRKLIPFDISFHNNQNVFIAISHGLMLVLDYLPIGSNEKTVHNDGEEVETFNFPIHIDSQNRVYEQGQGIIDRIMNL